MFSGSPVGLIDRSPGHRARYRVDGTLRLTNRRNLTLEGDGATLFATTRGGAHRSQLAAERGSTITISDLNVIGANTTGDWQTFYPDVQWQAGFEFDGTRGVTLDHVSAQSVFGDFVYLGTDHTTARGPATDVVVRNSSFKRAARQGVALVAARNVTIQGDSFDQVGWATFDVEPDSAPETVQQVRIASNVVGPSEFFLTSRGAKSPVGGIDVANNTLQGTSLEVLLKSGGRQGPWAFTGNTSGTPVVAGISAFDVKRVDGLTVTGNSAPIDRAPAVRVSESCGVDVAGNSFPGATTDLLSDGFGCERSSTSTTQIRPA